MRKCLFLLLVLLLLTAGRGTIKYQPAESPEPSTPCVSPTATQDDLKNIL